MPGPGDFARRPGASGDPPASALPEADTPLTATPVPGWKRASDLLIILLALPLVVLVTAILWGWIKAVSPGCVMFRQTRIGRGGKPFTIYKFRSMRVEAETAIHEAHVEHLIKSNRPMTKLDWSGDFRLIKGGGVIRMSGLDELPQLLNILRGEMSLVGPRPCTPNEFQLYGAGQRRRFSHQPGLTGLWQVERTFSTTFREMVEMDDEYIANSSPWLDLKIILKTPGTLFHQLVTSRSRSPWPGQLSHAEPQQWTVEHLHTR